MHFEGAICEFDRDILGFASDLILRGEPRASNSSLLLVHEVQRVLWRIDFWVIVACFIFSVWGYALRGMDDQDERCCQMIWAKGRMVTNPGERRKKSPSTSRGIKRLLIVRKKVSSLFSWTIGNVSSSRAMFSAWSMSSGKSYAEYGEGSEKDPIAMPISPARHIHWPLEIFMATRSLEDMQTCFSVDCFRSFSKRKTQRHLKGEARDTQTPSSFRAVSCVLVCGLFM